MKLFYRKYGNGPPLVILHGLYGSSDNWLTIAKSLSDNFTVYLPDQRNHGQSPHSEIHDYDSMRDDLFELVNDLKLKKFFLAGHSMGGKTAFHFHSNGTKCSTDYLLRIYLLLLMKPVEIQSILNILQSLMQFCHLTSIRYQPGVKQNQFYLKKSLLKRSEGLFLKISRGALIILLCGN